MNIQKAHISRQAEIFENTQEQEKVQQLLKDKAHDYVITARYLENLKAEERRMRG